MVDFFSGLGGDFLRGAANEGTAEVNAYQTAQYQDDENKKKFAQSVNLEQIKGDINLQNKEAETAKAASDKKAAADAQVGQAMASSMAAIGRDPDGNPLSSVTTPSTTPSLPPIQQPVQATPPTAQTQQPQTQTTADPNAQQQTAAPPVPTSSTPAALSGNQPNETPSVQDSTANNSAQASSSQTNLSQPAQEPSSADKILARQGLTVQPQDKQRIFNATSPITALTPDEAKQYVASGNDPSILQSLPSVKAYYANKGFDITQYPNGVPKPILQDDAKALQNEKNNIPIARNVNSILDELEPNINSNNFLTGAAAPETRAYVEKQADLDSAITAGNITKGTNALVTELNKFQYVPGQRGSVLGLQTLLASKPSIDQLPQVNKNIVADIRSKVNDFMLNTQFNEQYRDASPFKVTDANSDKLYDALKTLYPLQQVDALNGNTTYNTANAHMIATSIPDAISHPDLYIDRAAKVANSPFSQVNSNAVNASNSPPTAPPVNKATTNALSQFGLK